MHIKWSNDRHIKYLALFSLILALIATSLSVAAQDNVTSFTTSDISLSVAVPDGWTAEENGPGSVVLVNGEAYIGVTLVPANLLAEYELSLGQTAEDALRFVLESGLYVPQQENTEIGEIQALELVNATSAAQFSIVTPDQEGMLASAMYADGVVAYISVAVPPGEFGSFESTIRSIEESIMVSVTADELTTLIMN